LKCSGSAGYATTKLIPVWCAQFDGYMNASIHKAAFSYIARKYFTR